MKAVLALLFVAALVAGASAKATVAHKMEKVAVMEEVTAGAQATEKQVGCGCATAGAAVVTSDGGCGCQSGGDSSTTTSWRDSQMAALQAMGPRAKPEEVVKPIDEWLDNFKRKELLEGGLYDAAKTTVMPLLKKLQRTQEDAVERLKRSNREIREQVESAAVDHVYNMLKSKRAVDDAQAVAIGKQEQIEDAQDDMNLAKAELGSAKRAANEIKMTLMRESQAASNATDNWAQQRANTTKTILSAIDKILAQ